MLTYFLAWMAGWLAAIGMFCLLDRRRVVVDVTDSEAWQKILSRDLCTLRAVNADPIVLEQDGHTTIVDRGCTK